ncbi:MAG: protoglobin domain-containing protein [Candidatus Thiothrix sulfatifontis]|nr:MAG: protoglobin domain-containing protein [Candidatus Thiothrix sulfatifontis]
MSQVDMVSLCEYAKQFAGLDDAQLQILHKIYPQISPRLSEVTDAFYAHLAQIPKTHTYLEGRTETLKATHLEWLHELFNSQFDVTYTQKLYNVGHVHVKVNLPVEFMAGSITFMHKELTQIISEVFVNDPSMVIKSIHAISGVLGFSLFVMQESFQSSTLAEELNKFLSITGMSRALFDNLTRSYRNTS